MLKVNYKQFMKHAEKVAKSSSKGRPIMQGVEHTEDGTLTVTDGHRLHQAYNVNAPKGVIINAITGDEIESGTYPEVTKLLPNEDDAQEVYTIDNKLMLKVLKAMLPAGRIDGTKGADVQASIKNGMLTLEGMDGLNFNYKIDSLINNSDDGAGIDILLDINFLIETVEMYDDMKAENIEIRLYGNIKPLTIKPAGSNEIISLILPMR